MQRRRHRQEGRRPQGLHEELPLVVSGVRRRARARRRLDPRGRAGGRRRTIDAMSPQPATVPPVPLRAVLFDAYGTLFDVYSIGVAAERLFPGAGERLGVLWRDKQIEYTRLASMSGQARSFRDCTRAGLGFAAKRPGDRKSTPLN